MKRSDSLNRMIVTAVLLAVGMVLPLLTGQIPTIGKALSPLHIPAFICGLTCGWAWGAALGVVLPLLRSVVFGMPPLVVGAVPMAFELAVYGAVCGLLYPIVLCRPVEKVRTLKGWNIIAMIITLLCAMVAGRLVGGAAKAVVLGLTGGNYSMQAFVAGYFVNSALGAVIHLILVPVVVGALEKAKLSPMRKNP